MEILWIFLLDHAGEIALGLDILADAEVARALLEERVLGSLAITPLLDSNEKRLHTLFDFLLPPLPAGKGAAAVLFPFGGCH